MDSNTISLTVGAVLGVAVIAVTIAAIVELVRNPEPWNWTHSLALAFILFVPPLGGIFFLIVGAVARRNQATRVTAKGTLPSDRDSWEALKSFAARFGEVVADPERGIIITDPDGVTAELRITMAEIGSHVRQHLSERRRRKGAEEMKHGLPVRLTSSFFDDFAEQESSTALYRLEGLLLLRVAG